MTRPSLEGDFAFRLMSVEFRLRDCPRPPIKIPEQAGVGPSTTVLDLGCGPGGCSLAATRLAGREGRVYAVEVRPLAMKSVQRVTDQ